MLNNLQYLTSFYVLNWQFPPVSSDTLATFILVLSFATLVALEVSAPRIKMPKQLLRQSYNTNFSLFIFNSLMMSLLSASSLWIVAKQHFSQGVLNLASNYGCKVAISLFALDLLLYIWHRVCHRYDSLWMFHKVHHNDPYLNVSTGFRVHITEMFMTYILKALLIISLGIDEFSVLLHEVITTLFIMFHHTNSTFKGEQWLGHLITTPSLHRTHHSVVRNEHDSNYGAILSVWDRLFGSLLKREPAEIGIRGYSPQDAISLVKFGFVQTPPPVPMPANIDLMIAEAAYYKAEKRNFKPGKEWDDWLEAKHEIIQKVYINSKGSINPFVATQRIAFDWLNKQNVGFGTRQEHFQ
jgi:sterol desaturase/sphingolipid hydroxylase (fatty acid hydroxylase superfamily)